jgi:DegV family protein with EDD domain
MEKIKLMTDSASDISYENERLYDIQVVPFKVAVGDRTYISRVDIDNDMYYKIMDEYEGIPMTSQVTPYEFMMFFEEHYKNGYTSVINLSINSHGSATHSNACLAAEEFYSVHPEAEGRFKIYNIDSATYTGAYGYAIVEAGKMVKAGKSAQEIAAFIIDWCQNVCVYFTPYSLKYAAKSGRIPSLAAFMGTALGIKPVMRLCDHEIVSAGKVRSEKHIIPELSKRAFAEMEPGSPYLVVYGSDLSCGKELEETMKAELGYPAADYYQIGAAVATNSGPKVAGVIFRRKKA